MGSHSEQQHRNRRLSIFRSGLLVACVAVGLALLASSAADTANSSAGSSFSTAPDGLAAYATLVEKYQHSTVQLRSMANQPAWNAASTLVIASPLGFGRATESNVARFVRQGGTLVATSATSEKLLVYILGRGAPLWNSMGVPVAHLVSNSSAALRFSQARVIRSAGTGGSWIPGKTDHLLYAANGKALVLEAFKGKGRVIAIADTSVLANSMLANADNAEFGLLLLDRSGSTSNPSNSTVIFDQAVHGYGTGLAALPPRWRLVLELWSIAALTWVWSRARRLGPPQLAETQFDPPRVRHVQALALAIGRTRDTTAAADLVQQAAYKLLLRQLGIPNDGEGLMDELASKTAIPQEIVRGATAPIKDSEGEMAAGRALAWLSR